MFGGIVTAVPWNKLLDLARNLRKSGSDLVIEEDFANVFGRGKVVSALENQFKGVVNISTIIPLHPTSTITLLGGPGPTVSRAMQEKDRRYMSTVIQISFLGSIFNRTELATAITECMSKRIDHGIQDTSGPGFEDVIGLLEACGSQTSTFDWQSIMESVENRVRSHFVYFNRNPFSQDSRPIMTLPTHLLLAAMDYLYLIQSLPEDRIMVCKSERGLVPLIAWAHTILGLTIAIRSKSHEELVFGNSPQAQVIIHWRVAAVDDEMTNDSDIVLLDKDMKVVLSTSSDKMSDESEIEMQERHNLQSCGSLLIYRWINQSIGTFDNSPVYQDLIEHVLALVIANSHRIQRQYGSMSFGPGGKEPQTPGSLWYSLEYWRIASAAAVIFHTQISKLDENQRAASMLRVEKLVEAFQQLEVEEDPPLPKSVQLKMEKLKKIDGTTYDPGVLIWRLTYLVFIFSHVEDVHQCSEFPIWYTLTSSQITEQLSRASGNVRVNNYTIFDSISSLLLGSILQGDKVNDDHGANKHAFLVSDFGWSVSLHCVCDSDPTEVKSHLIRVRRGVPTNNRGERKSIIRDAEGIGGDCPRATLRDEGKKTYRPRCDLEVYNRKEYYASRTKEFWLSLRMDIRRAENVRGRSFDAYTSYRELHEALWEVEIIQDNICNHLVKSLQTARLGLEIVTFSGFSWDLDEMETFPQRICVCLTKGDQRARWLAINFFHDDPRRRVLLRAKGCCENCALDNAVERPGEWILVL